MSVARIAKMAGNAGLIGMAGYDLGKSQSEIKIVMQEPYNVQKREESEDKLNVIEKEIIGLVVIIVWIVGMYFVAKYVRKQNKREEIRIRDE